MPSVNPNEKKNHYMSRCIPKLIQEGRKQDQAIAICSSMYEESKKRKQSKGDNSEPDFDKDNDFEIALFIPRQTK